MAVDSEISRAMALHRAGHLAEAERCYRQILLVDPQQDAALHLLGVIRLQQRDFAAGIELIRQSVESGPPTAERLKDLGSALWAGEQFEQAEAAYRSALALRPDFAPAWSGLGGVLAQTGRLTDAIQALRNSIANGTQAPRIRLQLAALLADVGDYGAAADVYRNVLEREPGQAMAAAGLAQILLKLNQAAEAEAVCRQGLITTPDDAELLAVLGESLLKQDRAEEAASDLRRALRANPRHGWAFFNLGQALIRTGRLDQEFLLRWLSLQGPVPPTVLRAAVDYLKGLPGYRQLEQPAASAGDAAGIDLAGEAATALIANPILRCLMRRALIQDMAIERLLGGMRRAFLRDEEPADTSSGDGAQRLDFVCALAEHCFNNEYVFCISAEESAAVHRLRARIERGLQQNKKLDAGMIALAAAYFPLHSLAGSDRLLARPEFRQIQPVQDLLQQQIVEPREERALAAEIPELTGIADAVSRAVRMQYEENPYPRWRDISRLETRPIQAVLTGLFPFLAAAEIEWPRHPRILVAGCGTGHQPIASAQRFRGCKVTALDLSRASLAYAKRKTLQAGLGNIDYVQGDILELKGTPQAFDLIECAGVLHHMSDPLEGWRVLRGLLAPGGLMKIGLYSELGRRSIVAARDLVATNRLDASPDGIRQARQLIAQLPPDHAAYQVQQRPDFYSMSTCRDMIMHVQEHRLDTSQLELWLEALQLEFLGFELSSSIIARDYRSRFPDDPDMRSLRNWGEFEQDNTGAFSGMYLFWARDAAGAPASDPGVA